jgi:SOS-response transcriptional repressor LexA
MFSQRYRLRSFNVIGKTIGQRIRVARKARGLSQPALGKIISVSKSCVSQWELGEIKNIEGDNLIKLCKALQTTPDWILYGKGDMEAKNNNKNNEIHGKISLHRVPLIGWLDIKNNRNTLESECVLTTAQVGSDAFALKVKGDSMLNPHGSPSIPEGYIIIVDPAQEADNNDLVIAFLNDALEPTFKKLIVDGSKRYLKALNPSYPAIEVDDNCEILGKVVKIEFEP